MLTQTASALRARLGPRARQRLRTIADAVLEPVGSLGGVKTASPCVALTFDDGPDPLVTPQILDLLRERNVRATFFVLTERARCQSQLLGRMREEGHEIGLHFDRHEPLTRLTLPLARRRLTAALAELTGLVGPVRLFRPPFGAQSLGTYLLARALGLVVVTWGPYAAEWSERSARSAADRAMRNLKPGDIVLLHDGLVLPPGEQPPAIDRTELLSNLLDLLRAKGIRPMTVGDLLALGAPRRTAWFRPGPP